MYSDEIVIELNLDQAIDLLEFLKESPNVPNEGVDYVMEFLQYTLDEMEIEEEEEKDQYGN